MKTRDIDTVQRALTNIKARRDAAIDLKTQLAYDGKYHSLTEYLTETLGVFYHSTPGGYDMTFFEVRPEMQKRIDEHNEKNKHLAAYFGHFVDGGWCHVEDCLNIEIEQCNIIIEQLESELADFKTNEATA